MSLKLHLRENELGHLEISPDTWFYMNHIRWQGPAAVHDHNYVELAFVLGGSSRHTTVRGDSVCTRGDVLLIPRGAWHGYSRCRRFELVNCLFSPALLENELAWLRTEPPFAELAGWADSFDGVDIHLLRLPPRSLPQLRQRLEALNVAYLHGGSRMELLGLLLLVLDTLRTATRPRSEEHPDIAERHPSVQAALNLLHREYAQEWTLDKLAARLRLNSSYLVRLFGAHLGQPPMKYLAKLRAHRAATLLVTTRLRVGEIGVRVGWPEPKLFARQFQQRFGLSASEYRRKLLSPFSPGPPAP
ncbi:MAG: AraC family transcriptional regulator [Verrucomicrobiota bacterium JB024]|nr:AraC family transcriptional regulator [Verrucomicrobiota bacterium JB024]